MALYLGNTKASPSLSTIIEKTTTITLVLNLLGETISTTTETQLHNNNNYVIEDSDDLSIDREHSYYLWTRPADWPNLDAIDISNFEGVYLTYKNTEDMPFRKAGFYCTLSSGTQYLIETGYLDNSNNFIASKTETFNHNAYIVSDYSDMDYTLHPYIVLRISPLTTTSHFTRCWFGRIPVASTGTITYALYYHNFCVERKGNLPYVNNVNMSTQNSSTNYGFVTYHMEKDATILATATPMTAATFAGCWYNGIGLRVIDFTGWDTSKWTITSIANIFRNCWNLELLDLSAWDTSNWAITTLSYAFSYCYHLKTLNINSWNTTNWRVTNLEYAWAAAHSLEELDLSNWNTRLWGVTTLLYTWYDCIVLKKLNIPWNTINWAVTSLYYTWANCRNLITIDLSSWNTSNWAVTNLSYTWSTNVKRRNFFDIENWNTSNWKVTNLSYAWSNCQTFTSMNLNNWDTSKWKVTNFTYTWNNCYKLRELYINRWNVNGIAGDETYTGWELTSLAYTWFSCYKLKHITAFDWHVTKKWAITNLGYTFRYCHHLEEVDFSNWDTSAFLVTDMRGFTSDCRYLKKLIMTGIKLNITTANNYGSTSSSGADIILYNCFNITRFDPPSNWDGRIYFSTTYLLSRSEMIKFFLNLEERETAITITIGALRYKLTSNDITTYVPNGYTIA